MISLSRLTLIIAAVLVALTFGAKTIKAQDSASACKAGDLDPICVDPAHYKVLYENDERRLLKFDDTPGHKVPKHTHKYPFVVYSVTPSLRQFYQPDCVTKAAPDPVLLAPEDTSPAPPPVVHPLVIHPPITHCETNVGVTDAHLIVVEYKKNPPPATSIAQQRRPVKPFRRTPR